MMRVVSDAGEDEVYSENEWVDEDDAALEEEEDKDLPSFPFQLRCEEAEAEADGSCSEVGNAIKDEEESFAADFFRCGTDWSGLLSAEEEDGRACLDSREKKMKQANLLEIWGFRKKPVSPPPQPRKKMKAGRDIRDFFPKDFAKENPNPNRARTRACPFYKKIPGTPFTVDAFRFGFIQGCSAYFLTHFHYDHYGGLTKGWSHGPIYCTSLTARLIQLCLYVNPSFIRPLEFSKEYIIEGVKVTLLEANHCPGAALIHLRLPSGECYLHTGDFRASKMMQAYPHLLDRKVNVLYLDTTYCNPKYKFPSKEDVLSYVVKVTKDFLKRQPKTLVIVGAYSIGKECVYLAIAKALGVKIYANASRRRMLQSFCWSELSQSLCTQAKDTLLHVLPISSLKFETLRNYMRNYENHYSAVLAFRPTGWTYSENVGKHLDLIRPTSKGNVTVYGVPYSEHSSFTELKEFVKFLKPDKIIPTVNVGNPANRDKMQFYFQEWLKG